MKKRFEPETGEHTHECGEHCNHDHDHHHHHHHHHHHSHPKPKPQPPNDSGKPDPWIFPTREQNRASLEDFLKLFPEATFPLNLSSDTQRTLAAAQEPMSPLWVGRYLLMEGESADEFTEYMPCFSLPVSKDFHALVYWKASLEGNGYYLITFNKEGYPIDRGYLAGTLYAGDELVQTVCTLHANGNILQAQGRQDAHTGKLKSEEKAVNKLLILNELGELE